MLRNRPKWREGHTIERLSLGKWIDVQEKWPRDNQRTKVYRAEYSLHKGKLKTVEEAVAFLNDVSSDGEVAVLWPKRKPVDLTFHDRIRGGRYWPVRHKIELGSKDACIGLLLHEYAHHLADTKFSVRDAAAHCPEFVGTLHFLVQRFASELLPGYETGLANNKVKVDYETFHQGTWRQVPIR